MQVAGPTEGHDALGDGWDISLLVQVNRLEDIDVWHSVSSAGSLKVVDVFHHLELAA